MKKRIAKKIYNKHPEINVWIKEYQSSIDSLTNYQHRTELVDYYIENLKNTIITNIIMPYEEQVLDKFDQTHKIKNRFFLNYVKW